MRNPYAKQPSPKFCGNNAPAHAAYPQDKWTSAVFRGPVARVMDNVAIYYPGKHITSGELDLPSSRSANFLKGPRVEKGRGGQHIHAGCTGKLHHSHGHAESACIPGRLVSQY